MNSLEAIIRDLRKAAARARAARYAVHAVVASLVWVALVLVIARLTPFERRALVAAVGIPVALAIALIAWLLRRPSTSILMRLADFRLGLKERLSTAWERRNESGPMDAVQRRDALGQAAGARLANAFPVRVNRGEASLVAVLAIFSLALALLPNPMDQVLAQRQADRLSQARAAKAIETSKKNVAESTKPTPVDPQVQKILQDAAEKIRQADSPRKALESITPAEQQLQKLTDPGTPALTSSAQNLANALSATSSGRNAGQAISSSPAKGAQAVRDLASQLPSLSPKDREELAKALAKAAQQAQDSQMRDSLNKASTSLKNGDTSSAAQSLNDLASQLDSLQQQQNTDQQVASAINGLEAARQELASQADRDAKGQGAAGERRGRRISGLESGLGHRRKPRHERRWHRQRHGDRHRHGNRNRHGNRHRNRHGYRRRWRWHRRYEWLGNRHGLRGPKYRAGLRAGPARARPVAERSNTAWTGAGCAAEPLQPGDPGLPAGGARRHGPEPDSRQRARPRPSVFLATR